MTPSLFLSCCSRNLSQLGHGSSAFPSDQAAKKSSPSPVTGVVQAKAVTPSIIQSSLPVLKSWPLSLSEPGTTTSSTSLFCHTIGVPKLPYESGRGVSQTVLPETKSTAKMEEP